MTKISKKVFLYQPPIDPETKQDIVDKVFQNLTKVLVNVVKDPEEFTTVLKCLKDAKRTINLTIKLEDTKN